MQQTTIDFDEQSQRHDPSALARLVGLPGFVEIAAFACLIIAAVTLAKHWNAEAQLLLLLESQSLLDINDALVGLILASLLFLSWTIRRNLKYRALLRAQIALEHQARRLAETDGLTGLLNRIGLAMRFARLRQRASRDTYISMLVFDLDRFKLINDVFGHSTGDAVLKIIGAALKEEADKFSASAVRLGGDEFVLLLCHEAGSTAPDQLATAFLERCRRPIETEAGSLVVRTSIGIAAQLFENADCADLLNRADTAMYSAKHAGKNCICHFQPGMRRDLRERAELESEFRRGLGEEEFFPVYQPIFGFESGGPVGFECLARWDHPRRGFLLPELFIPIAEETGYITKLSMSLLRRACRDALRWPEDVVLSFNISPLELRNAELAHEILSILEEEGLPPTRLSVEITETALVSDPCTANAVLSQLKKAGVSIALDDFGTGYASLQHLRELQIDRIKIDRSFVQNLGKRTNREIVRASIVLAQSLSMSITAEGVECGDSAELLKNWGCEFAQGFYFGHPLSAADAVTFAGQADDEPLQIAEKISEAVSLTQKTARSGQPA